MNVATMSIMQIYNIEDYRLKKIFDVSKQFTLDNV